MIPDKITAIIETKTFTKSGRIKRKSKIVECLVIGQDTDWPRVVTPDGGYAEFAPKTLIDAAAAGHPVRL